MNISDLLIQLFTGFAVASLMKELLGLVGVAPSVRSGAGLGIFSWNTGLAFAAGPAYLAAELVGDLRQQGISVGLCSGLLAGGAWSVIYGYVVLSWLVVVT